VRDALPPLSIEEIDVSRHPEAAIKYGVMSTPAIAIDGKLAFSGVPSTQALLARLRAAAEGAGDR
jgi:protein-disulfide isomerase